MCAWQTPLHAVAQLQSVEQLAQDLSKSTPFEAVTSVTPLMDTLAAAPEATLAERVQMIFALDEAAQLHARSYIERFLALEPCYASERRSLWALGRGYWATVLDAYAELLGALRAEQQAGVDPEQVAQVAVRMIRAAVLRAKWDAFGGSAMDGALWSRLNEAYALAIRCGAATLLVRPRADRTTETTAEREYLRALALSSVSLEQLDPVRVELATSMVHYVLPLLELTDTPSSTSSLWADVARPMLPARLISNPGELALPRYFCGVAAALSLRGLLDLAMTGGLPPGLPLQREGGADVVASVLSRMIRIWNNDQPERRHRRLPMAGQMLVVAGFPNFLAKLLGDQADAALWPLRDASVQGIGVRLDVAELGRLKVGTLVGFKPTDGEHWCLGVVRRFKRSGWSEAATSDQVSVGVEKLGAAPEVVAADDGSKSLHVLLLDPIQKNVPLRVVVPVPGPMANQALYLVGQSKTIKLTPLDNLDFGVDFAVRTYLYTA